MSVDYGRLWSFAFVKLKKAAVYSTGLESFDLGRLSASIGIVS